MEKLKVIEIAEKYGVTKMAVYGWIKDGLPYETAYRPGRKPYSIINVDDVEDYIELKKLKQSEG